MKDIFRWSPMIEASAAVGFSTQKAQFGDGYKQAVGDGINNKSESWNLVFKGYNEEIQEIKYFLDQHAGYLPFLYAPKNACGELLTFECDSYQLVNLSHNGSTDGAWSLSCTFKQRFDL